MKLIGKLKKEVAAGCRSVFWCFSLILSIRSYDTLIYCLVVIENLDYALVGLIMFC